MTKEIVKVGNQTLDKYQLKAVKSNAKNLLVIAGAGSGKTLTIVGKIKYLLSKGIFPNEILCLTFTKAAAQSLENRLKKENINMKVHTFHSLGYSFVKNKLKINLTQDSTLNSVVEKTIKETDLNNYFYQKITSKNYKFYKEKLKETLNRFITLYKTNNYQLTDFALFCKQNHKQNDIYQYSKHDNFLSLAKKNLVNYQKHLFKNSEIDYADMINLAIKIIDKTTNLNYKYIIIDEYQDTSLNKCTLIKSIINKTKAKLMVVGDDWQSIYSFTGSNLNIFTNFQKYFPHPKKIYLKNTYRNSQELLTLTRKFITKNPNQLSKKLLSHKHLQHPIQIIYYEKDLTEVWPYILSQTKNSQTYVIGRNNKDIHQIPYMSDNMQYLTIHKSKGLEADKIVLINLEDNYDSLPNKTVENEFLKYVSPSLDDYPYAEERRLFYVALTRTKTINYLLVKKDNPSIFVNELLRLCPNNIEIIQ